MSRHIALCGVALLAFLAASCTRDSGGNGQIVRERRVALLNHAGLNPQLLPGGDRVRKVPREIGLMQRSCMVIPAGRRVRFEAVPIHAEARFTGYLGAVRPGPLGIELTVDGKRGPAQAVEAKAPGWYPFSIELDGFSGRRVALELRATEGSPEEGLIVAEPAVLSEGESIAVEDVSPLTIERLKKDLLRSVDQAKVELQDPLKPIALFPAVLDRELRTKADSAKEVLRAAPDSELRYLLDVPEGGYLEVTTLNLRQVGLDPGDMEFQVLLDGQEAMRVCSDFINVDLPDILPYDRLTHRQEIDLSPFAGRKVELVLRTGWLKVPTGPVPEYAWWDLKLWQRLDLSRRPASVEHPNVLVLCVDTLRADHVGCYGYRRNTTPNLDAFAADGIVFENAISTCSWTLPATASLLTGLHPNTHGVLGNLRSYLVDAITTLPEYLSAFGVTTAAFSANNLVCAAVNYDQGFELFDEIQEDAAGIHRDLFDWLDERGPHQFFGYVHYMEPHSPYDAPGDYRQHFDPDYVERRDFGGPLPENFRKGLIDREFSPEQRQHLVNLYDAEIFYWDLQFQLLLDHLEAKDLLDKTVIIVTSDHGEEFFDHGGLGHGMKLFQELLHVPLIVVDPRARKGRRGTPQVSTAGLFESVVRMMGFEPPGFTQVAPFQGPSGNPDGHTRVYSSTETHTNEPEVRWASVIEDDQKLIRSMIDGNSWLYDLKQDPAELVPLDSSFEAAKQQLGSELLKWYEATAQAFPDEWQPTSDEILERLKELGYINGDEEQAGK